MPIAISLSGGGAKGDFQLGALRYLYDQRVRPDILCGTSVGAVNAAKLAEGEDPAVPTQGLAGLERIWSSLRTRDDMYRDEPWLAKIDERLRKILTNRGGELAQFDPDDYDLWIPVVDELLYLFDAFTARKLGVEAWIDKAIWLGVDGRAMLEAAQVLSAEARALYNLGPIGDKISANLDVRKVSSWAQRGGRLRLAMVGLESGRLRYMTEPSGGMRALCGIVERDGTPVLDTTALPGPCAGIQAEIDRLTALVKNARLDMEVRNQAKRDLARLRSELATCLAGSTYPRAQAPLKAGILASAAIPGIFLPEVIAGETYVDGGVREIVPVRAAADLGADTIYAISCAPAEVARKPAKSYTKGPALMSIVSRSVLDCCLTEIAQNDLREAGNARLHVIRPDVEIHDATTIDPGLIQINRAYGYMRAADVVAGTDPTSRRWATATELTALRVAKWTYENIRDGRRDPRNGNATPPRPDPTFDSMVKKAREKARALVAERRALGAPVLAGTEDFIGGAELHQ